jgi:hypothetical protein
VSKRKHSDFPFFSEFLRGYLHQDAVPAYGNAVGAAKAYLEDLSNKDRKALVRELSRLRENLASLNASDLNHQLRQLGSAWTFESKDDFEQVLHTLETGH